MMTKYLSDFRRVGFRVSEIVPFLHEHQIYISAALGELRRTSFEVIQRPEPEAQSARPDWRELVAHWSTLGVAECADVMLDLNPAAERSYSFYDNNDDFSTWRRTIQSACESGALAAKKQGDDWRVTPAALAAWCQRLGHKCPLKLPADTNGEIGAESRPEEECYRLRKEVDRLQKSCEELNTERYAFKTEAERLRAQLFEVSDRSDGNGREVKSLRARVAELEAKAPQCMNPDYPRYAPRLAAAIRCWEAMENVDSKSFAKEVGRWIDAHVVEYNLGTSDKLRKAIAYLVMSLKDNKEDDPS
jgi:hypothetical protein